MIRTWLEYSVTGAMAIESASNTGSARPVHLAAQMAIMVGLVTMQEVGYRPAPRPVSPRKE